MLQLLPVPPPSQVPTADELNGIARQDSGVQGGEPWFGDVFLADGADGVKLSAVKKALADAGNANGKMEWIRWERSCLLERRQWQMIK